ncbi:hypothetical protein A5893_02655 [Pedobacter psychrophilus]|uniref:Sialate O-acetylesterase domain-containing protein n=1 Tax=Pedobacter psychrophilus TaxID=1826909 RepID=A0A179DNE5_9SPHI|nr:sialate O-acetylesterase [Pedobacter psychrophilus]OAQ42033.1 hypothetical protein A5893_02655 [Pedobacter psychrophilus]
MIKTFTKLAYTALLTLIYMLCSFTGIAQIITTLNPIADASVWQGGATNNYGSTTFQIKGSPSGQTRIGYVKFDLGTTAVADVKSAKFRMFVNSYPASSSSNVVVSSTSENWVESTLNYNNRPALNTALASVNITASGVYYEWDVTNYFKTLLATNTIVSFGLSDPSNSDKTIVFNKKEDATNKPELVISDTPSPSTNTVPVTFNNLFSDYAIIQQQKTATPLFGFAGIGTQITVTPSWNNTAYTGITDINGMWRINVATPVANGISYSIEAKDEDGHSKTINNIKLGEVWFCAGQSNMEMRLKGFGSNPVTSPIANGQALINAANDPDLRMFTLPTTLSIDPKTNLTGTWNEANPTNAEFFSAIAYQYALALKAKLNVPVGVIVTAVGGIPIQSLMSKESLKPFPEVTVPITLDNDKATPTSVYNGMVSPVAGYGIKGFIWYQGESNRQEPDLYKRLFPAMITDYRSKWNDTNLPFYFVQIAPNNYSVPFGGAIMREVLYDSYKSIPNTGISLPMEVGEANEIHYADKTTPANRLSFIALNKTYGFTNIPYLGPEFKSISFLGNKATLSFNYATGLKIKGNATSLFEIAGGDKVFVPATAVINNLTNQIEVVATNPAQVLNPAFVRYAFSNFVVGNLFNGDDLPASSFRTKNYDIDVDSNFHVYLLTGQSNMSGRGSLSQDTYVPNPRIKMLKLDGTWVKATNPLHGELEPGEAQVGPGISFAVKMLENADPNVTIGLIPTAIGGQSISVFAPGVTNTRTNKSIYDESVKYVLAAQTKGVLKGILFHQGEADNSRASSWVTDIKALISNFRTTFNQPKLPFVFGEMGRYAANPTKYGNILAVMPGVNADVPFTALVSSAGLTDIGDITHFNTASAVILGQRYADAMKGVLTTLPVTLTKFTATKKTEGALIQWTTASELNNDRFELERSTDGKLFSNIATVKGKGTSSALNNYSFTEKNPNNGVNYYRLVQYDLDGKISISDVVALTFDLLDNGNDFAIMIYPNPTKEKIFVNLKAAQNTQVKVAIYNLQGKLMKQLSFSEDELIQQDIQELKTGVYILRVNDANTNKLIGESKFLKN